MYLELALASNFSGLLEQLNQKKPDPKRLITGEGTTLMHYIARYNPTNYELGRADQQQTRKKKQGREKGGAGDAVAVAVANLGVIRQVFHYCLAEGCYIGQPNMDGITPLHDAAFRGCPELVQMLVELRAPLNSPTKRGDTPLMFAARAGRRESALVLLRAGADCLASGNEGTCMDLAGSAGMQELIQPFYESQQAQKREPVIYARFFADLPEEVKEQIRRLGITEEQAARHYKATLHIIRQVKGIKVLMFPPLFEMGLVRKEDVFTCYRLLEQSARGGFGSIFVGKKRSQPSTSSPSLNSSDRQSSSSSSTSSSNSTTPSSSSSPSTSLNARSHARYAMKEIKCKTQKDVKRALREVSILARIHHPNVVRFEEAFFLHNQFWVIQEYLQGGSLKLVLDTVVLEEKFMAHITTCLLRALTYVHSIGLVHRDVKPSNIMLTLAGDVKLIDFGLCLDVSMGPVIHRAGTCWYMAPEVILGRAHSYPVDIWSAGITVYEMCGSGPPFVDFGEAMSLFKTATGETPRLKNPSRFSPLLSDMLERCFKFDPEDRAEAFRLIEHPWITSNICNPADVEEMVARIFLANTISSVMSGQRAS
ncbi:MAG: protein kinase [archaeon]|nr:protein kinase [archaeon]